MDASDHAANAIHRSFPSFLIHPSSQQLATATTRRPQETADAMALRRWKPFLGAFQHIDAAIEASGTGVSRDEFRKARRRIVELLCDAAASNDQVAAEGLGLLLDEAMAGSLATLRAVPAGRIRALLAAPGGELVGAIGALMKEHPSERVRGLARDVVREWKLSVGAELARARTAMEVLDGISDDARSMKKEEAKLSQPKKTTIVSRSRTSNAKPRPSTSVDIPVAVPAQPPKKPPPPRAVTEEQKKMAATKRKLQERYKEVEEAKRQRKTQMIKPSRSLPATDRRQSSAHPAMRARGPAASGTSERRFIKPLPRLIRV